jgi:hypothetical protein
MQLRDGGTVAWSGPTGRASVTPTSSTAAAVGTGHAVEAPRSEGTEADPAPALDSFTMPNEVGKILQTAQDDVQRAAGNPLFLSHSEDATGQDRFQILDRNWQVCSQNIAPGRTVPWDGHVVFSVVKLDESCP